MKKLLSILLIFAMLTSLFLPYTVASAQTNRAVTFTLGSVQGDVGEIISVPLSVSAQSNIGSFTIYLPVPTEYLEYTTILDDSDREVYWESGEASDAAGALVMASNGIKDLPDGGKGITIACASLDGYWEAGTIISMYFKVIKQIPSSGITMAFTATEVFSIDAESNYDVTTVDSKITSVAALVIDQINALPASPTLNDEGKVVSARNAYNALNDLQKNAVTNLAKLQAAETAIAALKAQAKAVADQIDALNVQSLADETDVIAARIAYDDLSDEQKPLVTNLSKLTAAEAKIAELKEEAANKAAAQVVVNQIDALLVDSLDDETDVIAARNAYTALTDAQKGYVTNLGKLTAAEAKIAELKIEANNKAAAKVVSDLIAALSVDSLDDEADVKAARTAYNNLTDTQKGYVTNLEKLEAAEAKVKDYQFAQGVIDMINDLPADISLMDEDVVVAAREAYNALTDTQKRYVTNHSKLISAELLIVDLKAAQEVIDQIYGLPYPVTLADEANVEAARNAYKALTDAQKAFVTNLDVLVAAENEIVRLKALAEQEAADKAAAQVVVNQIDALIVDSLDDEADVVAARNAYKGLTDAQKGYVTNLAKLQAAEAKIAELKLAQEQQDAADLAAAKAVVDKINALNVKSLDDEADVVAARAAFNALTDNQKGLVTNLSKLEDAEDDIVRLKAEAAAKIEADKAAAKTISDMIDSLPATIVLTDESAVNMIRSAYNNLTDDQKGYVTNLEKLEAAEAKIAELKEQAAIIAADKAAAKQVDDVIDALDVKTLDDEPAVVAAREAYNALTDAQKGYVTKLDKLEAAEQAIQDLKNVVPPVVILYGDVDGDGKVSAADALEVLKSVVGKVTLTDEQIVVADVDGSGKVDAADALDILKKVVGKIDKFAVEQ